MYSGKAKKLLATITISASCLLLSNVTYAALSCSSLLVQTENLNPLQAVQVEIDRAKTTEEANALTYELVTLGNQLFDSLIDQIVSLNTTPATSTAESQNRHAQIQGYSEALQLAFRVPDFVLNSAIKNRLELEHHETSRVVSAQREKRAIGFERTESSEEFHADQPERGQIGYITPKETSSEILEVQNVHYLEFRTLLEEMAVKESEVRTPQEAEVREKNPIGFITLKDRSTSGDSRPLDQIGFALPTKSGTAEQAQRVETAINVTVGEFIVLDKTKKNPIGFKFP
ncbi:MAG: hypothetical protein ACRBBP_02955 [Bdellovibrionales bacterium]